MDKSKKAALLFRLLAVAATISASIVMATSHQTTVVFNVAIEAKYSQTPAFRFFVVANAVASVHGILILFLPSKGLLWRVVVALDLVVVMLLVSSLSAAGAIAQVGKKGNDYAGWMPICDQVKTFCDHVLGALIAGVIGLLIYFGLLLHSIHTVLNPLFLKD
ncbi:hypothetical protein QJS04_geneDACA022475 [Acorus gramineus]|uniref:CASP-like protein n=1 Tax=Acorus gramineus TaxID=55184 RepID=A0AAV9BFT1_ACOGR|nr:hypothetical protein QJS04_geneDACA022475 [Acorus gramineus]